MTVLAVCGMSSEAAVIGDRPGVVTVVGAGDAALLASKLEAAIAAGAKQILSLGVCGALSDTLQVGQIVVGVNACSEDGGAIIHCDKDWTQRIYRSLTDGPKPVTFPVSFGNVVSTIAPVATEAARAALRASTAGDVVDMESWVAASAAKAHAIPFVALRVVLDRYDFDLPPAATLPLKSDGSPNLFAILRSLFGDLSQGAGLIQLAGWSEIAMGNLAVALVAIGGNFCANDQISSSTLAMYSASHGTGSL